LCIIFTTLDVTEIIFAVLFVSLMGLTRCYKTTVFLHLYNNNSHEYNVNDHKNKEAAV